MSQEPLPSEVHTEAGRGPHAVGVVTLHAADPHTAGRTLPIEVWYPAAACATDDDPASWAEHPLRQPHRAVRELPASDAPSPLLVFSHGNSGMRQQSTFLTTHLASWGYVVAAPDHVGNTFPEMQNLDAERRKTVHLAARANRPRDLATTIDAVLAAGDRVPPVDAGRVGAFGHSFGGWTALKMPRQDERVRAVCGLAPAAEPFVGRRAFAEGELPLARDTPALLVAGLEDVLVDVEESVRSVFARLGSRRALVGIAGADHFHFCDGIRLLHAVHQQTPREGLRRPVRPYGELLAEERAQRVICALVRAYFDAAFKGAGDPCAPFRAGTAWTDEAVRSLGAAR